MTRSRFACLSALVLALPAASSGLGCASSPGDGTGGTGGLDGAGTGATGATLGSGGAGTGATGSGAAAGTGGTGATDGTGASDGTGSTGGGCESATTICDDFEGGIDAAWQVQMDSTPAPMVDPAKGYNSTSSLKTTGTSQQSFVAIAVPGQKFYARAYMNFSMSTEEMGGHGWFIVGADNVSSGGESQIRFGSSGNHSHKELDTNVYSGTCGGEKTQFSDGASDGASGWTNTPYPVEKFEKDTWYCVEVMFDGTNHENKVWVDGRELPGLHVTADTMCADWAPTYTHVKFGAGANSNIGDIWYDDVAVSANPIGCD